MSNSDSSSDRDQHQPDENKIANTENTVSQNEHLDSKSDSPQVVATMSATQFVGPLPPPEFLEAYNRVDPGFADRIVSMAEHQSEHRRKQEERLLDAREKDAVAYRNEIRRGQFCGLCVASLAIIAGAVMVVWQPTVASAIGGALLGTTGIASIITAFFVEQRRRTDGDNKNAEESKQDEQS